jgi:hypothetical protein
MWVRVVEVEGTPEEIRQVPELLALLTQSRTSTDGSDVVSVASPGTGMAEVGPGLPDDIKAVLGLRKPPQHIGDLIERLLQEALSWPDVDARIGASQHTRDGRANAVRLHRRGTAVGAFVYVRLPSGTALVRLPPSFDVGEYAHARPRELESQVAYGVAIRLNSEEALREAVELARQAYDRTVSNGTEESGTATEGSVTSPPVHLAEDVATEDVATAGD